MSPSLDEALPEYVITQDNNPPLTLFIEFQTVRFFLDISILVDQVQS